MSPQGKKIWDSPAGASLMRAMLRGQPQSEQDKETVQALVESSKNCQQPKPSTLLVSEMLTPSEIEQLRREQNERLDLLQKEFPKARIIR